MYIGEVSKKTKLSVKAIRFYEEKGLILPPQRKGQYRVYSDMDVEVLSLISEAKRFGVPLSRLKGVIVYKDGEVNWELIRKFLDGYRKELESQVIDMKNKIKELNKCISLIDYCPKS